MYRKILVPLDGSRLAERVLDYVRQLGKSLGSPINLLMAVERPAPSVSADLNPGLHQHETLEYKMKQAEAYLARVAKGLRAEGLEVSTLVREGRAEERIVDEADREDETLIAMSSHGRSGIKRLLLGSVADHVLHHTDKPLLIVGPRDPNAEVTEARIEREIIALDGTGVAEQVLPHAVMVAKALDLKTTLVRVTPAAGLHYYPEATEQGESVDLSEDVDARALGYLDKIRSVLRRRVHSVEDQVLHGYPISTTLIDFAHENPGSLLAVATHGRSGLTRGLLGSVAANLIRLSGSPVLVLRVKDDSSD